MSEQKEQSSRPRQQQNRQPGLESEMQPRPQDGGRYGSRKLEDKVALITGGDVESAARSLWPLPRKEQT